MGYWTRLKCDEGLGARFFIVLITVAAINLHSLSTLLLSTINEHHTTIHHHQININTVQNRIIE